MARIFIVGAGRVGRSLAHAVPAAGHEVVGLWNRTRRPGGPTGALPLEPQSGPLDRARGLREAELVLVCVSDRAVPEVGALLAGAGLPGGCVVAHTSGTLPAAALGEAPFARGSMHPLCALPDPPRAAQILRGAVFALEGDPAALPVLEAVAVSLGGRPVPLAAGAKPRYHAAAVLAANLVVALLDTAIGEAEAAGLPDAGHALGTLAAGAVARVRELGATAALTGPVARGDAEVVATHLDALGPEAAEIYRALSLRALEIARRTGLSEADAATLRQRLGAG